MAVSHIRSRRAFLPCSLSTHKFVKIWSFLGSLIQNFKGVFKSLEANANPRRLQCLTSKGAIRSRRAFLASKNCGSWPRRSSFVARRGLRQCSSKRARYQFFKFCLWLQGSPTYAAFTTAVSTNAIFCSCTCKWGIFVLAGDPLHSLYSNFA